jgi:hypothetical protein
MSNKESKTQDQFIGKAEKEQIEAWKKQYGAVYEITVVTERGNDGMPSKTSFGYLQKASRPVMAKYFSLLSNKQIVEAGDHLINNLWIGGDEQIRIDDEMCINAGTAAMSLMPNYEAEVKKL